MHSESVQKLQPPAVWYTHGFAMQRCSSTAQTSDWMDTKRKPVLKKVKSKSQQPVQVTHIKSKADHRVPIINWWSFCPVKDFSVMRKFQKTIWDSTVWTPSTNSWQHVALLSLSDNACLHHMKLSAESTTVQALLLPDKFKGWCKPYCVMYDRPEW